MCICVFKTWVEQLHIFCQSYVTVLPILHITETKQASILEDKDAQLSSVDLFLVNNRILAFSNRTDMKSIVFMVTFHHEDNVSCSKIMLIVFKLGVQLEVNQRWKKRWEQFELLHHGHYRTSPSYSLSHVTHIKTFISVLLDEDIQCSHERTGENGFDTSDWVTL